MLTGMRPIVINEPRVVAKRQMEKSSEDPLPFKELAATFNVAASARIILRMRGTFNNSTVPFNSMAVWRPAANVLFDGAKPGILTLPQLFFLLSA